MQVQPESSISVPKAVIHHYSTPQLLHANRFQDPSPLLAPQLNMQCMEGNVGPLLLADGEGKQQSAERIFYLKVLQWNHEHLAHFALAPHVVYIHIKWGSPYLWTQHLQISVSVDAKFMAGGLQRTSQKQSESSSSLCLWLPVTSGGVLRPSSGGLHCPWNLVSAWILEQIPLGYPGSTAEANIRGLIQFRTGKMCLPAFLAIATLL